METNEEANSIGAIGCILFDASMKVSRSSSRLPSLGSIIKDTVKGYFSRFILLKPTSFFQDTIPLNHEFMEVGSITGADMFIPSKVLKQIGLFDPNFFMYFEETDLQKRMEINQFKRLLISGPEIIHFEGQSNKSLKKYLMYYQSMFYYVRKHRLHHIF